MRIKPKTPDHFDLDAIRDLVRQPGWALVVARIKLMLERTASAAIKEHDVQKVPRLQAYHLALEEVLRLPQTLECEIKAKAKE